VAAPDTLGVARQAGAAPTPPAASAQQLAQLTMPGAKASVATKALPASAAAAPASTTANESALQRAEEKYQQAMAEKGQGAKEVATRSLLGALDLAPQHVRARLALAGLLQELKQSGAAAEVLSDGLMLLPRQTSFMLALAPLWIQAGQQKDALAMLTQGAPHAAATDGAFHAYYGTQLLTQSRPAEAAQRFRQALTSAPGNGEWQLGLGLSLQATGNSREAIDPLQRASASGQLSPQAKGQVDQMIAKLQQQTP
jgi:Tfp pilus assembly protein PilF